MFQDRWNSVWHVLFGMLAYWFPVIAVVFLLYQFIQGKPNDIIDVFEFAAGFLFIFAAYPYLRPFINGQIHRTH